ncbi:hypothetical protein ACER0C_028818 [Sarotherodon galilaeus]
MKTETERVRDRRERSGRATWREFTPSETGVRTPFVESWKSLKVQTEEKHFPQQLQQHENKKGQPQRELLSTNGERVEKTSQEWLAYQNYSKNVPMTHPGVRAVHGRILEVSIDDEEDVDMEVSMGASGLPGKCWACKWILNKMKKFAGPNATAESLKSKLLSVCDEIGLLKPLCRKFVKAHLDELIEELTTTDDVRTICVNTGACR